MFDIERWQEIFDTIRKNKLRTFLTGLSVASGIFILVILLGFGQGMQNGIAQEFEEDAATSIWVRGGVTTKKYEGLNPGRRIQFRNEDYETAAVLLRDQIEYQSPRFFVPNTTVTYGKESLIYGVRGISHQFQFIENEFLSKGRYISYLDEKNSAKVAIIGNKIKREVFKDLENPIGELIKISNIPFKIVGVYGDGAGEREEDRIFIPITTAQSVFNGADRIGGMAYTLPPSEDFTAAVTKFKTFERTLGGYLQKAHTIDPEDRSALRISGSMEDAERFYTLIGNIKFFFWFVGICTIIAGVVGVSNIMLIVVKERTREIGIRKALGAKPWSIIGMILHEAIFVTAMAGFSGLIFSMGLLEIFGPQIEVDYIVNPSVNFNIAFTTVLVLVFAGGVAGFFPAWRAARIQVITALRDE